MKKKPVKKTTSAIKTKRCSMCGYRMNDEGRFLFTHPETGKQKIVQSLKCPQCGFTDVGKMVPYTGKGTYPVLK